jgi:hypothetical protein
MIFTENLNWTLILTADFSVYSRLFRLPNLDTLILTIDFAFEMGHTAGATEKNWSVEV